MECIDRIIITIDKFIYYICNCGDDDIYKEIKKNDDYYHEEREPLINRKREREDEEPDIENQLEFVRKKNKTGI